MKQYQYAIIKLINESREHLSAKQIYDRLQAEYPGIVLATVYNNLNRLYDEGKIQKITLSGQPDRYDRIQRHDHLVCDVCGALTDAELDDLTAYLGKMMGTEIRSYDLMIHYCCAACRKQQHSGQAMIQNG